MNRKLIAKKPFEFSARVTLQLGRESISNSTVAISELIKNSYDADSESVTLDFHLHRHTSSTLIIQDSGNGMDLETLSSNWLRIGTDNKFVNGYSLNKKRVLTGAKGLGRLGIDRLCRKLVLYTKTKEMDTALQLNIDWKRFENSNLSLSDIAHDLFEVELPIKDKYGEIFLNKESSGTRMILLGLKDNWGTEHLARLENELRLLVSPFQAANEFAIKIKSNNGDEHLEKTINSEVFLNLAKWKVTASVDSEGFVSAVFTNNAKKFDISQEKILWKDWIKGAGMTPQFGPITCEFHYILQDTDLLKKVALSSRDLQRFMASNRGFRIYRDHFRVRPYGEPSGKGDWLDLGYRKTSSPGGIKQGGWRIGPNQLLGAILISREKNAILNDQANREGLVENEAFFQLRTFILKLLETFEILAHKDADSDKDTDLSDELASILAKSQAETNEVVVELKKLISVNNRRIKRGKKQISTKEIIKNRLNSLDLAQAKQQENQLKLYEALQLEKRLLQDQKDTLSNLASIGILTICFGHEVRQQTATASADSSEIIHQINDAKNGLKALNYDTCIDIAKSIKDSIVYIENFSKLALNNIHPDKRTRKKINIPSVFKYVFELMAETLASMDVKHSLFYTGIDESEINVIAYEIDWESIIINLLTNSLWAMAKEAKENRIIQIEFSGNNDDTLIISFKDSGIGLEVGMEESVFLPMHSSKRDPTGNSIGTGMGLAIVKNHIEDHMNGHVTAIATSSLGGAEFIFKLKTTKR